MYTIILINWNSRRYIWKRIDEKLLKSVHNWSVKCVRRSACKLVGTYHDVYVCMHNVNAGVTEGPDGWNMKKFTLLFILTTVVRYAHEKNYWNYMDSK